MKTPTNKCCSSLFLQRAAQMLPPSALPIALGLALLAFPQTARPATWDANTGTTGAQDGGGTWDTATANWWNGSADVVWPNTTSDTAVFGAGSGAAGTVNVSGTITLNALTFNAPGSGNYTLTGGTALSFGGTSPTINIASGVSPTIESVIDGVSGLSLTGAGVLTLSGNNSFTGNLNNFSGALLKIKGAAALGTGTKTVSVQNGVSSITLDGSAGDISIPATISFNTSGLQVGGAIINFAGNNTINGAVNLNTGAGGTAVEVAGGSLTLAGAVGGVGSGTRTLTLQGAGSGTVSGQIKNNPNTAAVLKTGTGTWTLTGANSFTGGLTVKAGTLLARTSGSVLGGSGTGAVTLGDTTGASSVLLSIGNSLTLNNPITVQAGSSGTVTINNFANYSPIFNGTLTLNKNLTVNNNNASGAQTISLNGNISGNGGLVVSATSAGNVIKLTGSNSFGGGITLTSGTLAVNSTNALGAGALTIAAGTLLDNSSGNSLTNLKNNAQFWNGNFTFFGSNPLDLGTGAVTLNDDRQVTVTNVLGVGPISGTGFSLTKAGPGTLKLSGASSYSGSTFVNSGTLALNAAASLNNSRLVSVTTNASLDVSALSSFSLGNGTTLTGGGAVTGSIAQQSGATISPGSGVGTLTVSGTTTLNQGGNLAYELSNDPISGVNDLLSVGVLNCVGTNTVSVKPTGTDFGSGSYTLINYGSLTAGDATYFNAFTPATQSRRTFVFDTSTFGQVKLNVGGSPLATLYWAGDGLANTWNYNSSANWTNGAALDVFKQLDTVVFDDAGSTAPLINVVGALYPNSVTFSNQSVNYTLAGSGSILAQGGMTLQNAGAVTLANTGSNSFSFVTINNGSLTLSQPNTLGTAGNVWIGGGGANAYLGLTGGNSFNSASLLQLSGKSLENPALLNISGTNVWSGSATLNSGGAYYVIQSDAGKLVLNGNISSVVSGGRTLYLEGDADGEIKGAIANGAATVALNKYGNGTWTLSGTNTYTGATTIGSLSPRTGGKLVVNGSLSSGAVTVYSGTLAGYGSISGPVAIYDNLDLGSAIGTLTIANTLSLQSTVNLKVARNGTTVTNDQVAGLSTVTYGGTLNLTTNSTDKLQVGDTFKLFSAASYAGTFATINYPNGYTFTNRLAVDGTITVLTAPPTIPTAPTNLTFSVTGGALNLSWPASYLGWSLQVQTNNLSNGLGTNWVTIPGSELVTSTNLPIVVTNGAVFYRMKYVP